MRHFNGYSVFYLGLAIVALGIHSYSASSAHIIVASIAILFLTLAALNASIVTVQHYLLKKRHLNNHPFLSWLPPVETMQALLFRIICAGFIFLSLSFVGAFIFFPNVFVNIHTSKLILCTLSWILFATLIYGYYRSGWRNQAVTYSTLVGLSLLTIALI